MADYAARIRWERQPDENFVDNRYQRPDRTDVEHLHERAQSECRIANSVTSEVVCEPVWPA